MPVTPGLVRNPRVVFTEFAVSGGPRPSGSRVSPEPVKSFTSEAVDDLLTVDTLLTADRAEDRIEGYLPESPMCALTP